MFESMGQESEVIVVRGTKNATFLLHGDKRIIIIIKTRGVYTNEAKCLVHFATLKLYSILL